MRVLIANDEPVQLAILKVIFEKCGFETYTTQNGNEAYEQIVQKTKKLGQMFDLVVLDLDMPVCDGYDACKKIKSQFENKNMPAIRNGQAAGMMSDYLPIIIAVSGFIDDNTENKIVAAGFKGFFQAPLGVQDIQELIMPDIVKRKQELDDLDCLDQIYKGMSMIKIPSR